MKLRLAVLIFAGVNLALAARADSPNLVTAPSLPANSGGSPNGWTQWTPFPFLAPKGEVIALDGGGVGLALRSERFEQYGRWDTLIHGIQPGKFYRIEALYQTENVVAEKTSVIMLASWCRDAEGKGEVQGDYIDRRELAGNWRRAFRTLQAPAGASTLKLELGLRWTDHGAVKWKEPRVVEVPAPAPRIVRVATTRIIPALPPTTIAANTQLMAEMFDRVGPEKPDIVLFSENLVDRATRLSLAEKAQTIPGPLTDMLTEKARRYHTYVITTLHERDEAGFYHNTAVLIDRAGRIVGKYRKVHLTIDEADAGMTPGSEYPIYETDFAKIGILTCWDDWFSEPARILRLRGAEILFHPLAGDGSDPHWDAISRARAVDNGLFLVSSSAVSDSSRVIDRYGTVIGEARGNFSYVVKELDLNQEWRQRYLGEGASLYLQERRPETYSDLTNGSVQSVETVPAR